jgi:hypothetical protein
MLAAVTATDPPVLDIITADDIGLLNRAVVTRAAAFARIAGTAVIVVGAVGVVAWAWLTVRHQIRLSAVDVPFGASSTGLDLVDRVDIVVADVIFLLYAAFVVGVGVALRLAADYTVAGVGGSLTGFEPGDELPTAPD